MSIETPHNSTPNESYPYETVDTINSASPTIETPTAKQVRKQVHEDHKPTFVETHLHTRGRKFAAAIALASTLIGGGLAVEKGLQGMGEHSSDSTSTTHNTVSERDGLRPYRDLERNSIYQGLSVDQQDALNPLLYESVASFEKEPEAARFKFGTLVYDTYIQWGIYNTKDNRGSQTMTQPEKIPTISLQSSGQDIVNDVALKRTAQWYSLSSTGAPQVEVSDRDNAIKMESIISAPNTFRYKGDISHLTTNNEIDNKYIGSTDLTVQAESAILTTPDGTKQKIVQGENLDGVLVQQRFMYQELPDYAGKTRGNWIIIDTMTRNDPDQSRWIADLTQAK